MNRMRKFLYCATLLIAIVMGGSMVASCSSDDDNSNSKTVTLEDVLNEGTIVALTFELNDELYDVAFMRVGDTYQLLSDLTRSATDQTSTKQDFDFTMEHDKANNLLKFYVKEKNKTDIVATVVVNIKESTIEVIPGNSQIKVSGMKMKISNIEVTDQLKPKETTLADAFVKGATVVVTCQWMGNPSTVFTFVNNGGSFGCTITGFDQPNFTDSNMKTDGTALIFDAVNWNDSELDLNIRFNTADNTYKFMTVHHSNYKDFSISINGTDITPTLKKMN